MRRQTILLAIANLQTKRVKTHVDVAAIDGLKWALNNYKMQ